MQRQHDQEMKALKDELGRIRRDLAARDAQLKAAQSTAPPAPAARPVPPPPALGTPAASAPPAHAGEYQTITGQAAAAQRSLSAAEGAPLPSAPTSAPGGLVQRPSQVPPNLQRLPYTPNVPGTVAQEQAAAVGTPNSTFRLGVVTVTLGGFAELAGIYRSRNEVADIVSNFNTSVPLPQSPLYHEPEFRLTSRQSRFSVLVQGKPDPQQALGAYLEADFLSAAPTANANELNGCSPRLCQAYGTYDNASWHFHLLGGQSWSLITQGQVGIIPRQENIPLTIDADFVPGFTWARQPGIRVAGDFADHRLWLAASLENPQTIYAIGPSGAPTADGTPNYYNPSGINFAPTVLYSDKIAPDVIVKAALDPGWGHYEIYGLARFLHDRVSAYGSGHGNVALAGGGGAAVILPLVPGRLTLQASGLAGYGIGQFPDATLSPQGAPVPLPEVEALVGLVAKPAPMVDLYAYVQDDPLNLVDPTGNFGQVASGAYRLLRTAGPYVADAAEVAAAGTAALVAGGAAGAAAFFVPSPLGMDDCGPPRCGNQYVIRGGLATPQNLT